jgi:hypothetical protein
MVLQIIPRSSASSSASSSAAVSTPTTSLKILHIAKLKCLHYICRTFMTRNLVQIVLSSSSQYFESVERFLQVWGIPEEFHAPLRMQVTIQIMYSPWFQKV